MSDVVDLPAPWSSVDRRVRERGLRWTPQRRTVIEVLAETDGHVTGAELVERCRARDASTIASTVYRTLDVLEDLDLVRHGHGPDGREEYHVLPVEEHGHLHCAACGASRQMSEAEATAVAGAVRNAGGFEIDIGHVTLVGRCGPCAEERVR
jgi:Fur family transcriptional regulator, ferric uptake regulator